MNGILALVGATLLGADVGWRPLAGGGLEYIVQIKPEDVETLKTSQDITSDIPPELVRQIRRIRFTVGRETLPRLGAADAPAGTLEPAPAPSGGFRPNSNTSGAANDLNLRRPGDTRYSELDDPRYAAPAPSGGGSRLPTSAGGRDLPPTDYRDAINYRDTNNYRSGEPARVGGSTLRDPFTLPADAPRSETGAPRGYTSYSEPQPLRPGGGYDQGPGLQDDYRRDAGRDLQMAGNNSPAAAAPAPAGGAARPPATAVTPFANSAAPQQPIQPNYASPPAGGNFAGSAPPPNFGGPTSPPMHTTGHTGAPPATGGTPYVPTAAAPPASAPFGAAPGSVATTPGERPWFPFAVTIIGFFASLGGNVWMYWNMQDTRLKYRQLVTEFDSGGRPRRSRREREDET